MLGSWAEDVAICLGYKLNVSEQDAALFTARNFPYPLRSIFPLEPIENQTFAVDIMVGCMAVFCCSTKSIV